MVTTTEARLPGEPNLRCRANGFSLFELLVVLLFVGIMVSFTTLSIRSDEPADVIEDEARRFDQLLQLLLEEAILRGEDYGVAFKPRSYRFTRYLDGKWQTISDDRILRPRELPEDMELDLAIEQTDVIIDDSDDDDDDEQARPQVFVLSSGEFTPGFSVAFFYPSISTRYIVTGAIDGSHEAKIEE